MKLYGQRGLPSSLPLLPLPDSHKSIKTGVKRTGKITAKLAGQYVWLAKQEAYFINSVFCEQGSYFSFTRHVKHVVIIWTVTASLSQAAGEEVNMTLISV